MNEKIKLLADNIEKSVIGKREVIIKLIAVLLSGGHILIEDVPGVGKTRLVTARSESVNGVCNRIQFTPDLMPSDITGFTMINNSGESEYRQGAAICNFLLADEINRASPKAQSALLEIMEELQVSIDGATHKLPSPFMALATQNPVETYGTYHLPEAQMDRFMMKLSIGYPEASEEMSLLGGDFGKAAKLSAVISLEDILELRKEAENITVKDSIKKYIVDIVTATRVSEFTLLGASPRGSLALYSVSKSLALIEGRSYVIPEDVKRSAVDVLSHRLMLSPKGKSVFGTTDALMTDILTKVSVPAAEI